MNPLSRRAILAAAAGLPALAAAADFPDPVLDPPATGLQTAVLAGGCFWCTEIVFEHVEGVKDVVSGYSGGTKESANYDTVSTGTTGHAESVQIRFDAAKISYGKLLKVFFEIAHDPTQLNRQGPDHGPQYRSAIFFSSPAQQRVAEAYVRQLTAAHVFDTPIVTQIVPLEAFYPAEEHHQNFCRRNPNNRYVRQVADPKVDKMKRKLPGLLQK